MASTCLPLVGSKIDWKICLKPLQKFQRVSNTAVGLNRPAPIEDRITADY